MDLDTRSMISSFFVIAMLVLFVGGSLVLLAPVIPGLNGPNPLLVLSGAGGSIVIGLWSSVGSVITVSMGLERSSGAARLSVLGRLLTFKRPLAKDASEQPRRLANALALVYAFTYVLIGCLATFTLIAAKSFPADSLPTLEGCVTSFVGLTTAGAMVLMRPLE